MRPVFIPIAVANFSNGLAFVPRLPKGTQYLEDNSILTNIVLSDETNSIVLIVRNG